MSPSVKERRSVNEFRRDPVTGHLVIISTARDARPNQFKKREPIESTQATNCQFCSASMETPPIVSSYDADGNCFPNQLVRDWQVCVVPNLYPSLTYDASGLAESDVDASDTSEPAHGFHEVVIESPTHATRFSELTEQQVRAMLFAYRDRMKTMQSQAGVRYVQVIKNSGEDAGASVRHSHSQIFGLPLVPDYVQQEIESSARLQTQHGQCVFCKQIDQELQSQKRIVLASEKFVAWCPYASRVSYELHVAPRTHHARFEESNDVLLGEFASFLQQIVGRLERHPRIHAFNYLLHSLPVGKNEESSYHWHFEVLPRIAKQAGFEWGTGIYINTIAPENAAREIRDAAT